MPKKLLLSLCFAISLLAGCSSENQEWRQYQARFITPAGRIVDNGNDGVSHSEGQGYGMLLAVAAGDKRAFIRIWDWTRQHLQVRGDHLFIWRRRPGVSLEAEDSNNATDGDLLIAWALLEGADRWQRDDWRGEALDIGKDLKRAVVRSWQGRPVLLPGKDGFEHGERLILNLSYWVYPALSRLAELDPDPVWGKLIDSGLALTGKARFGPWKLPPDWLEAGKTLLPWRERQPRFGYDAVRIPLYLVWGRQADAAQLQPFLQFWQGFDGFVPPWIDLQADCMAAYAAPAGIRAIRHLTRYSTGEATWFHPPEMDEDYYSATLVLLSRLAMEGRP